MFSSTLCSLGQRTLQVVFDWLVWGLGVSFSQYPPPEFTSGREATSVPQHTGPGSFPAYPFCSYPLNQAALAAEMPCLDPPGPPLSRELGPAVIWDFPLTLAPRAVSCSW